MTILYESEEDLKRVAPLDRKAGLGFLGIQIFSFTALIGIGEAIIGFIKKSEPRKTGGLITAVVSLMGIIYSIFRAEDAEKELSKPENRYLVRKGIPLSKTQEKLLDLVPGSGVIGEVDNSEVVQGRKAWEARMAEQEKQSSVQPSK